MLRSKLCVGSVNDQLKVLWAADRSVGTLGADAVVLETANEVEHAASEAVGVTAEIDRGSEGEGEDGRTTLIDRGKEVGGGGGGKDGGKGGRSPHCTHVNREWQA